MCILCVIQKWSRRVATMLPWLVIPLIGLWLLSQFLPPAFRFEITSPRLACVFVLLITLFWYEILMPQLSAWRVRRNARLRERKRSEAIEMQKLRKTATRRCRNCLTPYRDQNPGGGRFMCSYCGHISKRPVLDLPIPPGLGGLSNSGILKDLVGKGGKMLNGKVWSDNGWICGQDWLENSGNWVGGSFSGNPSFRGAFSNSGDEHCFAEKSYSRFVVFLCKCLAAVFLVIMWVWRKIFRVSSSDEDASTDAEIRGLAKKGENGINGNESRSEKARRKAEEKRQARLEKEQLEEEERKQREEVARLVEERRKLRDEKTEAEKDRGKVSPREKTKTEKKRQERKKEKDRGSSKSNSDVDELEKRAIKEIEKSRNHRVATTHNSNSNSNNNNNNIGSYGTRYLDRMKGSFLSSSRAFTNGGFFGKGTVANSNNTREHKSSVNLDHVQNTANRRDLSQPEVITPVKCNAPTDDKNINRPVPVESQPSPAPKKSWQQLFTRTPTIPSSSLSSSSNTNVISRPKAKSPKDAQSSLPNQEFVNPASYGLQYTLPNFSYADPIINNTNLQLPPNIYPRVDNKYLPEESDIFEDPCYVPDPVSLIGPVSESLDNFQLDIGFQKPNPIRYMDEMKSNSNSFFSPSTPEDMKSLQKEERSNINNNNGNEKGWQMWESSPIPIYQDGFGLAVDQSNWIMQPPPQKTMASLFKNDEQNQNQNQGGFNGRFVNGGVDNDDPWLLRNDKHLTLNNEMVYGSSNGTATNHHHPHPFQLSQGNFWAKKERGVPVTSIEGNKGGSASATKPVGGLYSTPDVQSLWSYE